MRHGFTSMTVFRMAPQKLAKIRKKRTIFHANFLNDKFRILFIQNAHFIGATSGRPATFVQNFILHFRRRLFLVSPVLLFNFTPKKNVWAEFFIGFLYHKFIYSCTNFPFSIDFRWTPNTNAQIWYFSIQLSTHAATLQSAVKNTWTQLVYEFTYPYHHTHLYVFSCGMKFAKLFFFVLKWTAAAWYTIFASSNRKCSAVVTTSIVVSPFHFFFFLWKDQSWNSFLYISCQHGFCA